MPGFFEAINNLPPVKEKVHTVTIQGQSLVVTLEKKLEVMKHGEDAYMWKSPTEIMLKPRKKIEVTYPQLKKSEKGYNFHNNDPFYPKDIVEGGYTWQTDTE